jgi:sulfotransferase family protein
MSPLKLPQFIIAGAPRCATTWLRSVAEHHPALAMSQPARPEPKFFLVDELYERGIEYYSSRWFADLPRGRLLGEKSTNYLESPKAAQRIHVALPQVRLIFMVRNPVYRAWSNYLWSRQNGLEDKPFTEALELEDMRERSLSAELRYVRPHAYFSRGLYADLLAPYFSRFGGEQILVLRQEDVIADPAAVATRFHRFLGVEPRPQDAAGLGIINGAARECPLADAVASQLAARYAEPNRRLAALLGSGFPIW